MNADHGYASAAHYGWLSLVVGAVATVAAAAGYRIAPEVFFPAYLVAYLFWLGIALGSWALVMLHNLTGGAWGVSLRLVLESAAGTLPLVALMFLPLAWGMELLYPWARPDVVAADPLLAAKAGYLNVEAFFIRAAVYFVLWCVFSWLLNHWSAAAGPMGRGRKDRRQPLASGPGLVVYGLTVTFASIDWAMSLEPHWYSAMYGVLFIAGHAVSALAFATVIHGCLRPTDPEAPANIGTDAAARQIRLDLGNLLLAAVMFWTYIAFMQYLIIWSANLPEEVTWYLHRSAGSWRVLPAALIGLHFLVPFFLLLSPAVKQNPRRLASVAVGLLVMQLVHLAWLVLPPFYVGGYVPHWLHLATPLAVGGLWLAAFFGQMSSRARLPWYAPGVQTPDVEGGHP